MYRLSDYKRTYSRCKARHNDGLRDKIRTSESLNDEFAKGKDVFTHATNQGG